MLLQGNKKRTPTRHSEGPETMLCPDFTCREGKSWVILCAVHKGDVT